MGIDGQKVLDEIMRQARVEAMWTGAQTKPDRWQALKRIYAVIEPELLEAGSDWTDPYFFDFANGQSPIESLLWQDLRSNRVGMYPEYPVARYFVDFWNPSLRIGIEADGKQWHDRQRDTQRDAEIFQKTGGLIIRVTGAECHRGEAPWARDDANDLPEDEYDRLLADWYLRTSSGVVRAVSVIFGGLEPRGDERRLADATLQQHCLVPQAYFAAKARIPTAIREAA